VVGGRDSWVGMVMVGSAAFERLHAALVSWPFFPSPPLAVRLFLQGCQAEVAHRLIFLTAYYSAAGRGAILAVDGTLRMLVSTSETLLYTVVCIKNPQHPHTTANILSTITPRYLGSLTPTQNEQTGAEGCSASATTLMTATCLPRQLCATPPASLHWCTPPWVLDTGWRP